MWDVAVAGAGPAGSIAALVLARSGCRVLIADAEDARSHKVGESLPAAAVRILRSLDVQTPEETGSHQRIGGNLCCWGSDELVYRDFFRDPEGVGWRLNRRLFDVELRDAAIGAGAFRMTSRIIRVHRVRSWWTLQLDNGQEITTRWLLDASGRKGDLSSRFGAKRRQDVPLIAVYSLASLTRSATLNRTVVEAVPEGWWYAARLPCGRLLAGFHVSPKTARRIIESRAAWCTFWDETRHVSRLFGETMFTERLTPLNASGARLDRFQGDGWISCGDAALSFDPISSQGLLTALYGGMLAGKSTLKSLNGDLFSDTDYTERLNSIREIYRVNLLRIYREERRWQAHDFWRMHQEITMVP